MGYGIARIIILWFIGGITYYGIEIAWRNYSHFSMFILGGLCFVLIGLINKFLSWKTPLWKQCGIATIIITVLEFITGCIVNLWLGWNVWNYTQLDLLGQICLPMIVVWYFLSIIGIILDDLLRHILFSEKFEGYRIWR